MMQEVVNDLSILKVTRGIALIEAKDLLMNRSLLNLAVAVPLDTSQHMRHIAYDAIINLISVRRRFRVNEVPFFSHSY